MSPEHLVSLNDFHIKDSKTPTSMTDDKCEVCQNHVCGHLTHSWYNLSCKPGCTRQCNSVCYNNISFENVSCLIYEQQNTSAFPSICTKQYALGKCLSKIFNT